MVLLAITDADPDEPEGGRFGKVASSQMALFAGLLKIGEAAGGPVGTVASTRDGQTTLAHVKQQQAEPVRNTASIIISTCS